MTIARFNSHHPFQAYKPEAKLNVVILYDRLADISKASATYLNLTRGLAEEFSPDFQLWRIDLSLKSGFCFEAERDLAEADVILVAVSGEQKCPVEFLRWKDGAGHEGGRPPHAVVALIDTAEESQPTAESWSGLLHEAATQINPEVFVCEVTGRQKAA